MPNWTWNKITCKKSLGDKLIKELDVKSSLYHWCDMLDEVKPTSNDEIRYVYNLDKKEYVDLFKQPTQWCHYSNEIGIGPVKINSFALLTGCGNGLGGGDYFFVNHQSVGSWAGDRFVSSKEPLEEYKKFKCRDEIYNECPKGCEKLHFLGCFFCQDKSMKKY